MSFEGDLFDGTQVLVVGGTSGIGAAIARSFALHGAEVHVTGVTAAAVQEAQEASALIARGSVLDVRDPDQVADLMTHHDHLDVLVNCAGVIQRDEEHDPEVFSEVVDVNLNGTMRCCAAARLKLAAARGCIINTASMLSFFGGGRVPGYAASKGGVAQLTKSLALAYAADGIRVNALAPGWIATALTEPLRRDPVRSGSVVERTPLRRWGTPQDVAGAALFLASPAAAFITGVILPVDGGYLIA